MMSLVIKLLMVVLGAYLLSRLFARRAPAPAVATAAAGRSERGFAFVSNGQLFYRERGGELQQLHSPYIQEALDRRDRARDRHSWKQGTSFNVAAGGGMRNYAGTEDRIPVTSAAYDGSGNLLYFLRNDSVGGLFCREAATGNEQRLLLKQHLHLADLNPSPDGAQFAASSREEGGTASIVVLSSDGHNLRELTGGDTMDSTPAWIPGTPNRLLFQSAGLARGPEGYVVAQGPASIQKLDMEQGTLTPILEDPAYDFLKPRVTASGDLLFIRRPYQAPTYGARSMFTDTLFFPFRLLRAVFHYLNFFSLMYARKPLTSAEHPGVQADMKSILLQGRRIDAEKALREARPVHGVPSLVPESWLLMARDQNGAERVLATNVASYDIGRDGAIVYSNGRGVFVLERDGSAHLAATDELVGEVVAASA